MRHFEPCANRSPSCLITLRRRIAQGLLRAGYLPVFCPIVAFANRLVPSPFSPRIYSSEPQQTFRMSAMDTQAPAPARPKAAGLTNILNNDDQPSVKNGPSPNGPPPQLRDSGFYSTADASSKRMLRLWSPLSSCLTIPLLTMSQTRLLRPSVSTAA